ncbi:hypothetical protein PINS_up023160 [Pythium insidiosum]|nr:hypothetical protein PINS_up011288 [Pythium insidiosum]GLE10888.1 hypothetical protein PINS_up023160 [Pythium insidiosum]
MARWMMARWWNVTTKSPLVACGGDESEVFNATRWFGTDLSSFSFQLESSRKSRRRRIIATASTTLPVTLDLARLRRKLAIELALAVVIGGASLAAYFIQDKYGRKDNYAPAPGETTAVDAGRAGPFGALVVLAALLALSIRQRLGLVQRTCVVASMDLELYTRSLCQSSDRRIALVSIEHVEIQTSHCLDRLLGVCWLVIHSSAGESGTTISLPAPLDIEKLRDELMDRREGVTVGTAPSQA